MPSTNPRVLVTSAAGHIGRPTVLQLRQHGFPVRAFVRRRDARAAELEAAGAEIFVGDIHDFRDLTHALTDVQRAFHCPPFSPNVLYDASLFAVAAENAKLECVTLMGAWNPHAVHPSIHQRGHWIAQHLYRWMPSVDVIHLTPGFFAFDYFLGLPAVVHFGQLMLPLGDGQNAPPSNEDIARVAAATLANPAPHVGKVYRPTGPALLSPAEIADIMGHVLTRKVTYKDASFRMFQKAAIAQGYPIEQIAHVRYYADEVRNGAYAMGADGRRGGGNRPPAGRFRNHGPALLCESRTGLSGPGGRLPAVCSHVSDPHDDDAPARPCRVGTRPRISDDRQPRTCP